jgi:hypothetical protein
MAKKKNKKNIKKKKKAKDLTPVSEAEEEKTAWKKSNMFLLIAIIVIAVIAASILIYVNYERIKENQKPVFNSSNYYQWGNYTFIKKEDNSWETVYTNAGQQYILNFYYGPRDLLDLEIEYENAYFGKIVTPGSSVYIVIDPNATDGYVGVATTSLSRGLNRVFNVPASGACTQEHEACGDRPIIPSCMLTPYPTIFVIKDQNTSIVYRNNCLFIKGEGQELIRAANKVLLGWYGII